MTSNTPTQKGLCLVAMAISAIILSLSACDKLIEVDLPIDQLTPKTVFGDSAAAESAVVGLYSRISYDNSNILFANLATLCPALSADELRRTTPFLQEIEFMDNAILEDNVTNYTMWRNAYSQIYHINSLLEQLAVSQALSDQHRNQLMGEVRFLRGFHYFYLANLYGAVPLALDTDYRVNASLSRTETDRIYEQVIADLTYAESALKPEYPMDGRVRVNKWGVSAFLARFHLYRGEWEAAAQQARVVIESGMYKLESLEAVFKGNSWEAILQFYPPVTSLINTRDGLNFIPASGSAIPTYELTEQLLAAFESGDKRKQAWVAENTVNGKIYAYPYKYKVRMGGNNTDKTEYSMPIRLAEMYLISAEALFRQGRLEEAIADIDEIRNRAGLPSLAETWPAISASAVQAAIQQERQVELFMEWGHRWFDLKRTGQAEAVLSPIKPGFTSEMLLYPIPQQDMLRNPFLDQNEGYGN